MSITPLQNLKGFTLIELLVVVALIGILATIAIPQYSQYKESAFDAAAKNDLRTALTAEEAAFIDTGSYVACRNAVCITDLPTFKLTKGVVVSIVTQNSGLSYAGVASHPLGKHQYSFNNQTDTNIQVDF